MIMFGEIHGTNEVPALVSAVARELAEEGERILVALEILDLLNGDLAEFVAGKTEVDEFLAGELFWSRDPQDGRSSHAMLQLIQDIRGYRNRGLFVGTEGLRQCRTVATRQGCNHGPQSARPDRSQAIRSRPSFSPATIMPAEGRGFSG